MGNKIKTDGAIITTDKDGDVVSKDASSGGLLIGKKHSDLGDGIKAIVKEDGRPILIESGEVIVNKEAAKLHWKALDKINTSAGNGAHIHKPQFGKGANVETAKNGTNIETNKHTFSKDDVTFEDFHLSTFANYSKIKTKDVPSRTPDFKSNSGSKYWYEGDSVIRESNHWGRTIASCNWLLGSSAYKGQTQGICKLSDFVRVKERLLYGEPSSVGKRFKVGKTVLVRNGGGRINIEVNEGVYVKESSDYYIFENFKVGKQTLAYVKEVNVETKMKKGGGVYDPHNEDWQPQEEQKPEIWKHKYTNATAKIISDTAKGYKVEYTDNTGKKPKTTIQYFDKQDFKGDRAIFEKIETAKQGANIEPSNTGKVVMIPTYMVEQIKESIKLGYNKIQEGMIGRVRRGVMLMNENYEVRGTYDIGMKDAIQQIINESEQFGGGANIETNKEKFLFGGAIDDKDVNLALAKKLDKEGVSQNEIRQKTGWFVNPFDKMWRMEIDDSLMSVLISESDFTKLENRAKEGNFRVPLNKIIQHDELFERYPFLNKVKVEFSCNEVDNIASIYVLPTEKIIIIKHNLYEKDNLGRIAKEYNNTNGGGAYDVGIRRLYCHEIQHILQIRHGFNSGYGESKKVGSDFKKDTKKALSYAGEIESKEVERRLLLSGVQRWELEPFIDYEINFDVVVIPETPIDFDAPPEQFGKGGNVSTLMTLKEFLEVATIKEDFATSSMRNRRNAVDKETGEFLAFGYFTPAFIKENGSDEIKMLTAIYETAIKVAESEGKQVKENNKMKTVVLPENILNLINYLNREDHVKNKAIMWNNGDEDLDIASRGHILPAIGNTLWQCASGKPYTEVKNGGVETKIFFSGNDLLRAIKACYKAHDITVIEQELKGEQPFETQRVITNKRTENNKMEDKFTAPEGTIIVATSSHRSRESAEYWDIKNLPLSGGGYKVSYFLIYEKDKNKLDRIKGLSFKKSISGTIHADDEGDKSLEKLFNKATGVEDEQKNKKTITNQPMKYELPAILKKLMPKAQQEYLKATNYAEHEDILNELAENASKLKSSSGGDQTMYLHYFYGNMDWYVSEYDKENATLYGFANIGDDLNAEFGSRYVSELTETKGIELDFYFEPTAIKNIEVGGNPYYKGGVGESEKEQPTNDVEETEMEGILLREAKRDVNMLENEGVLTVTDTKLGLLWGSYDDNDEVFSFNNNKGKEFFRGSKSEAIEFLKNQYQVEESDYNIFKLWKQYFEDNGSEGIPNFMKWGEENGLDEGVVTELYKFNAKYVEFNSHVKYTANSEEELNKLWEEDKAKLESGRAGREAMTKRLLPNASTKTAEPAQRAEEKREEKTGKNILTSFFTPDKLCEIVWAFALHYSDNKENPTVLEPSFGNGQLIKYAPNKSLVTGFEINKEYYDSVVKLFPQAKLYLNEFTTAFLKPERFTEKFTKGTTWLADFPFDICVANPPYGDMKTSKYVGFMDYVGHTKDVKAQNLYIFFMYWSLFLLKTKGVGVFVVPSNFMRTGDKYNKTKQQLSMIADLVELVRIPDKSFDNTSIGVDVLVFIRK